MAEITFEDYLKGRSREEMMRSRQRLMDDFKEFKRRRKVMEQRQMAKSGKMIKASEGKMTEADLQKKVDRDARIREEKSDREVARELRILKTRYAIDKAKERNKRFKGMSKGGMCRGMGAAIRGGDFKGVK